MTIKKYNYSLFALASAILLIMSVSCKRDIDVLEPAAYPTTPEVFIDGFSAGLNYAAFGGSKVTAFDVDTEVKYSGTSSMKIEVPDFEDPQGAYAGGAYFTSAGRDLSGYDALTFWAKASQPASIDIIGIGQDLAEAKYVASRSGVAVNSNWQKYVIPIPDPSKKENISSQVRLPFRANSSASASPKGKRPMSNPTTKRASPRTTSPSPIAIEKNSGRG